MVIQQGHKPAVVSSEACTGSRERHKDNNSNTRCVNRSWMTVARYDGQGMEGGENRTRTGMQEGRGSISMVCRNLYKEIGILRTKKGQKKSKKKKRRTYLP